VKWIDAIFECVNIGSSPDYIQGVGAFAVATATANNLPHLKLPCLAASHGRRRFEMRGEVETDHHNCSPEHRDRGLVLWRCQKCGWTSDVIPFRQTDLPPEHQRRKEQFKVIV